MLERILNKSIVYFSIDFDLRADARFFAAVQRVADFKSPQRTVVTTAFSWDYSWPKEMWHLNLSPKRLGGAMLGLETWQDRFDQTMELMHELVNDLQVSSLKRIGFKIIAFMPLKMSQAEAVDLFYGSFLAERASLPFLGEQLDPQLHFEGKIEDSQYIFDLTTVNNDQAARIIEGLPSMERFLENKLTDRTVSDFQDRVSSTEAALFLDVDYYQKDLAATSVRVPMKVLQERATSMLSSAVGHFESTENQ